MRQLDYDEDDIVILYTLPGEGRERSVNSKMPAISDLAIADKPAADKLWVEMLAKVTGRCAERFGPGRLVHVEGHVYRWESSP